MKLYARTNILHRGEGPQVAGVIPGGGEFEINDRDGKVLVTAGEAETAEGRKKRLDAEKKAADADEQGA